MFGTDGIRGEYGKSPITSEDFYKLGIAYANTIKPHKNVLIAHDGRESAASLQLALTEAITSQSINVIQCGILPTPALARLAEIKSMHAIMLTASHNPASDNGVKLLLPSGVKWDGKHQQELSNNLAKPICSKKQTVNYFRICFFLRALNIIRIFVYVP